MYTYTRLKDFAYQVFVKMGCPAHQAETASKALVSADLRGVDSHGVARLSGYVRLWEGKRINPKPDIRIIHETPSTAVVDGDSGLGLVVGPIAMKIAMKKAKEVGTGWV
ncbi:MAG: Ldh family oxidoreductase, partial [Cyclobacteriaceae bacterium]|nr:Ldh family oxidoreductase [Cyclobacteriaceae bacterium]